MSKILNISFIDENSVKVTVKDGNSIKDYAISDIEKDKGSVTVMNEIKKLQKVLNSSVLKKLDKGSTKLAALRADKLREKIDEERKAIQNESLKKAEAKSKEMLEAYKAKAKPKKETKKK